MKTVDQMRCAQSIPQEVFRQGQLMFYALMRDILRDRDPSREEINDTIERAATYLSDALGYTQEGARFYFQVEIMASIRNRFRDAEWRRDEEEIQS